MKNGNLVVIGCSLAFKASGAERLKASGAERLKASGAERLKASGAERLKSSGAGRLKAFGKLAIFKAWQAVGIQHFTCLEVLLHCSFFLAWLL